MRSAAAIWGSAKCQHLYLTASADAILTHPAVTLYEQYNAADAGAAASGPHPPLKHTDGEK